MISHALDASPTASYQAILGIVVFLTESDEASSAVLGVLEANCDVATPGVLDAFQESEQAA